MAPSSARAFIGRKDNPPRAAETDNVFSNNSRRSNEKDESSVIERALLVLELHARGTAGAKAATAEIETANATILIVLRRCHRRH